MKILIDIPTDQYNEIVYVNYERLRDIVRDGVVIEKCEDAVSREEAINVVHKYFVDYLKLNDDICLDGIRSLSPVTPQRPQRRWIHPYKSDIACECSECHIQMPITNYYHYCPNCGAEMSGGDPE